MRSDVDDAECAEANVKNSDRLHGRYHHRLQGKLQLLDKGESLLAFVMSTAHYFFRKALPIILTFVAYKLANLNQKKMLHYCSPHVVLRVLQQR